MDASEIRLLGTEILLAGILDRAHGSRPRAIELRHAARISRRTPQLATLFPEDCEKIEP
jgi:hypothetical protein